MKSPKWQRWPLPVGHLCLDEGWRGVDVASGSEDDFLDGFLWVKSMLLCKSVDAAETCLSCAVETTELCVEADPPQQVGLEGLELSSPMQSFRHTHVPLHKLVLGDGALREFMSPLGSNCWPSVPCGSPNCLHGN